VAVFGVPDETWGETAVAAVRLEPDSVTPDQLRVWINDQVSAKYQRVRAVVAVDDFPRNATGKTLKRTLRERYLAERT
jgi:acyl-CoA synthetase (AMP-forming)/AMP-acid ligase II